MGWKSVAWRDRRGVAALEFAIVAPVLAMLGFGVFETVEYSRCSSNLQAAAYVYANSISMQTSVTGGKSGSLSDFCAGAVLAMLPFNGKSLQAYVASYTVVGGGLSQDWSDTSSCQTTGGTALTSAELQNVKTQLTASDSSVIVVKLTYKYSGALNYVFSNGVPTSVAVASFPIRNTTPVACSGCST